MKKIVPIIITIVLIGGLSFYGGTKYTSSTGTDNGRNPRNFQGGQQSGRRGGMGNTGNLTTGKILTKDDKSITVELQNGGSRIVFFSGTTQISKSAEGTFTDLEIGKNILITGKMNTDGSMTAEMIQLRNPLNNNVNPQK